MNDHDPPPLGDPASGAPPFLREALGAARADVPRADQIARLVARLPLAVPPPPPVGGASGPAAPGPVAAGPAAVAPAAPSVLSGAMIGAALGVLVSGAGFVWQARDEASAPPRVTVAASAGARSAAPVTQAAPAVVTEPARGPAPPVTAAAAAPSAVRPAAPAGAAAEGSVAEREPGTGAPAPPATTGALAAEVGAGAPGRSDLHSEVELLERARRQLGASPGEALALTQEHATRFPRGRLDQERDLVAIQALVRLGRTGEARARRDRFVTAYPRTPFRPQLEALLGP